MEWNWHGYQFPEVPRPNRRLRRAQSKSDEIDAYAAARRLLDGSEVTAPKNYMAGCARCHAPDSSPPAPHSTPT